MAPDCFCVNSKRKDTLVVVSASKGNVERTDDNIQRF